MRTGIVADPIYLEHDMGRGHPECPQRLASIAAMLAEPAMAGRFGTIPAREATAKELAWIHTRGYVEEVARTKGKPMVRLDGDTSTSPRSYEAALMAAGGTVEAVRRVWEGEYANAFALVRPPGHHAEASRAMGFCLFNNVAIAACYAREVLGAQRVLVLDWDLHHGNGTQNSFYDRADVLYASTHQFPYYPGSGDFYEVGYDEGAGFTVNVPMSGGYGDGDFAMILDRLIRPIAREFRPDLVLVSAGFDIYERDPLGAMSVTAPGFGVLTRILLEIAEESARGRAVFVLEGGYNLVGLAEGVRAALGVMAADPAARSADLPAPLRPDRTEQLLARAREVHRGFWRCLA
jgi:acetoin utilization deacetylase AcuC-like enzyme